LVKRGDSVPESVERQNFSPRQGSVEESQFVKEPHVVHSNADLGPEKIPRKRLTDVLDDPLEVTVEIESRASPTG
jgi:hypothetical protein